MKQIACLVALLTLAASVGAQVLQPSPQAITVIDSGTACVTAPTACATWNVGTASTLTIQIQGTYTGTLTFEATADGTSWFSVLATNLSTGAAAISTTTTGQYAIANVGFQRVRVRATASVTGGANLTAMTGRAGQVARTEFLAGTGTQVYRPMGTIYWQRPAAATTGGSTTWVTSTAYALPANTLTTAGDQLQIDVVVLVGAATTDNKNVSCNLGYSAFSTSSGTFTGGQSVVIHSSASNTGTVSWWAHATLTRLDATTASLHEMEWWEGSTTVQSTVYVANASVTWATANNFLCAVGNITASNTTVLTLQEVHVTFAPAQPS